MAGADTAEPAMTGPSHPRGGPRRGARIWRGLTGALTAGWVVVTAVVVVAQIAAWGTGGEGPGAATVFGHLGGSALALGAQHVVDRARGASPSAASAGAAVLGVTAALLWLFWYS